MSKSSKPLHFWTTHQNHLEFRPIPVRKLLSTFQIWYDCVYWYTIYHILNYLGLVWVWLPLGHPYFLQIGQIIIHPSMHPSIHPSIHASCIHSFIHPFLPYFLHSFIHHLLVSGFPGITKMEMPNPRVPVWWQTWGKKMGDVQTAHFKSSNFTQLASVGDVPELLGLLFASTLHPLASPPSGIALLLEVPRRSCWWSTETPRVLSHALGKNLGNLRENNIW